MNTGDACFVFNQIHIDVARNATDDFNLFHEPVKWRLIENNPFAGPIVLGFQLESLIEAQIKQYRHSNKEDQLIDDYQLRFSNYQFNFANAIKPGDRVEIDIKQSQFKPDNGSPVLSNRIAVKTNGTLALAGYKKESQSALFLPHADFAGWDDLKLSPDRSILPNYGFFLKRKFINLSNGKNFLCGSLVDQHLFFDELEEKIAFPEIFPCSLISCALLEKAWLEKHDFKKDPMVYSSHKISLDRRCLSLLKSNSCLHILVKTFDHEAYTYQCYGLVDDNQILFRAIIALTPLKFILDRKIENNL
jgi:hypothetical protein